jgi:hypothetical protein
VSRLAVALAIVVAAMLAAGPTGAEHEIYYRYTMLGYVKDAKGHALAGREITIVRDKTGFSYLGETDAKGLYVVVLRLGDESRGEHLTVRAGAASTQVVVRFDVSNRTEERGTRVDLEGGRFVERSSWFPSTLTLYLGGTKK